MSTGNVVSNPAAKTVAFTSPDRDQDGKIKILGDEIITDIDPNIERRFSIPDSDTDSNRGDKVPFSGLYPVVFLRLKQTTRPRIWCLRTIENPWFERISMMVILMNCVTLGLYEPCEHKNSNHCNTSKCSALEICDHFVFAFFAIEMLIKMIAMGVWGKLGYLGDKWNRLDAFIVFFGVIEYAVQMEGSINFTAIRTIRVLRPLRAINRVASMRILVMLLLDTLPMLGNVLLLCSFVFFIFGIVAVQLWAGLFRQRCFLESEYFDVFGDSVTLKDTNTSVPLLPYFGKGDEVAAICADPDSSGMLKCSNREIIPYYEVQDTICSLNISSYDINATQELHTQGNQSCIDWNQYYRNCSVGAGNPFQGAINFDNIMYAWVAIFQVISLEGWVDIMYHVMDAHSFYSFIYFILLIVIGSFFMINLCLVVIATQFSETKQREQKLIEAQRLRFKSNDSTLASYSPPGNTYEELLKYISHLYRKNKRKFFRWWQLRKHNQEEQRKRKTSNRRSITGGMNNKGTKKSKSIHLHHHHHHHHHHYHISNSPGRNGGGLLMDSGREHVLKVGVDVELHPPRSPSLPQNRLMITDGREDSIDVAEGKSQLRLPFSSLSSGSSVHSITGSVTSERSVPHFAERRRSGEVLMDPSGAIFFKSNSMPTNESTRASGGSSPHHFGAFVTSNLNCSCSGYDVTDPENFESEAEDAVSDVNRPSRSRKDCFIRCLRVTKKKIGSILSSFSSGMKRIVDSRYYQHCIMGAILVNTLSMGIEHHQQPQTLTNILEISNIVFTTIFGLEMVSKLIAYGILGYIANLYNVFDAAIVIISVCEIITDSNDAGGGGLSVLRTFRLLRVLKLVRFLPALRRQLVVLMKTMDNVATFMMLLTLFIFIFSILGMHLFGCKFCRKNDYGETECDRKNFDTLLWACVTVFQILTQEDWNVVLYNGMDAIGPFAAIYFITLMTIGNYVLFNLLVAILVEGFQAECYSGNEQKRLSSSKRSEFEDTGSILAKEYTEQIARSLGLQTPFSRRNSMQSHHDLGDDDVTEELSSDDSEDSEEFSTAQQAPKITVTDDNDTTKTTVSGGALYQSVPIITHTSATPTNSPTPNGSPSIPRFRLEDAFNDKNDAPSESVSIKSQVREGRENGKTSQLSPVLHSNRKFPTSRRRSTSSESRRSSVSSGCSRSGSWKLRKSKPTPLDQQSLVEWEDSDNEEQEEEPDVNEKDVIALNDVSVTYDDIIASEQSRKSSLSQSIFLQRTDAADEFEIQIEETDKNVAEFSTACCLRTYCSPHCTYQRVDWPLYIIPPRGTLRLCFTKMVSSKWFDNIILLFIFANCITIAMEKPTIDPNSTLRLTLDILNYVFTAVFTIEMIVKVIAYGFCIGEHTYLKSGWNVLDFLLVVTSLIDLIITLASTHKLEVLGILRVFRLLRALRPLRVISRAPGLKLVVQTLISSLKPIGNIVLICCAFFIIFGILGVQLFKGKFYHCEGEDIRNVTDRQSCENATYIWENRRYNFDDLGQALMSLFVLSSKDGWVEIMYNGLDAVAVDKQPIINYNPSVLFYFISFLLIVGFFVINMFVGVVVENFHRCREEHEQQEIKRKEEARLRKEEKLRRKNETRQERIDARRKSLRRRTMSRLKYNVDGVTGRFKRIWKRITKYWKSKMDTDKIYESYGPLRRKVYNFCTNKYFELGVSAVIGINIITMAIEHYDQSPILDAALKYANYVFTAVFVVEAILKIWALGVFGYFRDPWNHMDMAIVILSIVGIVIEDAAVSSNKLQFNPTIVRFMRVLRIARVLKLLKVSKGIRSLLETVFRALPQVGNLGLLFLLLFFIYAALGVELFGTIKCDDRENECEGLGRLATFENFGIALLTLFRISTGDNWNGIMKDTLSSTCNCSETGGVDCYVNCAITPMYFVTFVMMAQFVLVNVVIAVLMKQLEDSRADSSVDDEEEDNDVFESEDEKEIQEDDQVLPLSNRQDVAISDELVIAADVTETSSISEQSSKTTIVVETQDEAKKSTDKDTEQPCTPEFDEPNLSRDATKRKSESSQPSIIVLLPPPPPAPSNSLHLSGCKSTGASPSNTPRHGTLPVRTKSLNLHGSQQNESSSIFDGHLPLQPRRSDPTKRSPGGSLTADGAQTSPNSHRRIKRHFSDNPISLRPNNQSVHHHHHYHVSPEALSKSANNVSVQNPHCSNSDSKTAESSSVSELLSKSANNISHTNPTLKPKPTEILPIPGISNSTAQSISKSANNVSSLTPSNNLLLSKRTETNQVCLKPLSKSSINVSSLNPSNSTADNQKSRSNFNLPAHIGPFSQSYSEPTNNNYITLCPTSSNLNEDNIDDKKLPFPKSSHSNVPQIIPEKLNAEESVTINGSTSTETDRNFILPKPSKPGSIYFPSQPSVSCSDASNAPKIVQTNATTPLPIVSNQQSTFSDISLKDDWDTPPNELFCKLPNGKQGDETTNQENRLQQNSLPNEKNARKADTESQCNANGFQNVISNQEKWVEFSDESLQ